MSKHQKHTKLKLRDNDNFAPNEIAIDGTKCSVISNLVQQVSEKLQMYKLAYLDASHSEEIEQKTVDSFTFNANGTLAVSEKYAINNMTLCLSTEIILKEPSKF